ncbi:hypothetical protein [Sphingomonas sp. IW22]|uniref:hypothetical protein n=1 Tax=Sphingomonas sp. IW22 TaxID=3242489 RepID=UPI0035212B74
MSDQKLTKRVLLLHYWKKGLTAAAATRDICDIEGKDFVKNSTTRWWFQRFKQGVTSLEDNERPGRPSVVNKEVLRAKVEQQPCTSTRRLSDELGPSQSTINRHLRNLGFVCRNPLQVPHILTEKQSKHRLEVCRKLLTNPQDIRFWKRIVTGDEKWIFFRNSTGGKQWLQSGQSAQQIVKTKRFEKKVMLCVWWNFEGPIHWELVPDGRAIDATLYAEQLKRVHDVMSKRYPALVNRGRVLLQHDNAPAHTSRKVQQKLQELSGFEVLPHPAYSPDLAPSDFHLFRSLAHFLQGRCFTSEEGLKNDMMEFFASKSPDWYRHGIELLAQRWLQVTQSDGLYFEE